MKRAPKLLWIVIAILFSAGVLKATLPQVVIGTWTVGADLSQARSNASAVMLSDGRILVAGGDGTSGPLQTAEFFASDGTVSSAAPMNVLRSGHFAVTLSDGRVLVGGGISGGGTTNSAEIYDPSTDSWTQTNSMTSSRANATAALLQDGRVLIAGGDNSGTPSNTIEIYDPSTGNFSFTGTLSSPRTKHAMATMQDGRVLIVGGFDGTNPLASSDIFDPSTGNVSAGPTLTMARYSHSATTLLNGTVVVAGGAGAGTNGGTVDLASAEVFDPSTGAFTTASASLSTARQGHQAFLLPNNNNVLIVGGTTTVTSGATSSEQAVATSELFMSSVSPQGVWTYSLSSTGSMNAPRTNAAGGAMKQDGLLLAAGGSDASGNTLASTELYAFPTLKTDQTDYAPGSIVTITGSGWQPGETVALSFLESPLIDTHPTLTAVADGNGNISNSQFSPDAHDINVRFYLTAVGSQSGLQAQNTFTDGNLSFVTSPFTIPINTCSPLIQIQQSSNPSVLVTPSTSSAGGKFYSDSACSTQINQVTTSASTPSFATLYYKDSSTVSATITITDTLGPHGDSDTQTETIGGTQSATTLTLAAPSPSSVDFQSSTTVTLTATLKAGGTPLNQEKVEFFVDGVLVGNPSTGNNNSGLATFAYNSASSLSIGGHTVQAVFEGNSTARDSASTSGTQTLTVNKRMTSTSVSCTPASVNVNSATSCTATVTDNDTGTTVGPTGSVSFTTSGSGTFSPSASCALGTPTGASASCSLSYTPTAFGTGTHTIAGSYGGDTSHSTSTSAGFNLTVKNPATTTTVSSSSNTSTYGTSPTFTATVAPASGSAAPTGTVQFKIDGTAVGSAVGVGACSPPASPNVCAAFTPTAQQLQAVGSPHSITAAYSGDITFAASTSAPLLQTVNKATLTVTGITASNKVYDGTTTATINTGIASLVGVVSGDTVNLSTASATGAFSDKIVGTGKTVTVSGLTISGASATNYTLTQPTTTANITAKVLTVTGLSASNKIYDATLTSTLSGTAALQAAETAGSGTSSDGKPYTGDTISVIGTPSGSFATKDVATGISVSVSGLTLGGADAANYIVTAPTISADITPKALAYSGLTVPASKVYDGTTTAVVSGTAALQGTEAAGAGTTADGVPYSVDSVSLSGAATGTYNVKDVATATTVTFGGMSLTGTGNGNYTLTTLTQAATITAKALTYSGLTVPAIKVYDGTTTAVVSGTAALQGTEAAGAGTTADGKPYSVDAVSVSGTPTATYNSKDVAAANLVTFAGVSLTGTGNGNYTLTALTQAATITAKALTYSGLTVPASKTYDGTIAAVVGGTAALQATEGAGAGTTADGKPYNVDAVSVSGTPTATYNTKDVATASTVTFGGVSLTGTGNGNYTLTALTQAATITAKALDVGGLAANNKIYDATNVAAMTGTAGLMSAEASGTGISSDGKPYTGDTVSLTGTPSGTFASKDVANGIHVSVSGLMLSGGDAGNYSVITPTLVANITPKALDVTGLSANNKIYDATTAATLLGTPVMQSAEAPGAGNTSDGIPYAGDAVSVGGTASGSFASKEVANGIHVSVSGLSITGGQAGNYTLTAPTLMANITTKALNVTGLMASNKVYDGLTSATLTGTAALLTAEAPGAGNTLDGTPYTSDVEMVNGTPSGAFASQNVANGISVSVSGLSLGGAQQADYSLTAPTLSANITPATLTYTSAPATRTYGANDPPFTGTVSGFVSGENQGNAISGTLTFTTNAMLHSNVGSYAIDGSGLTANYGNYVFVQAAGNATVLTITKADATINVTPYSVTYTGAAHTAAGTAKGVFGENLAGLDLTGTAHSNASDYPTDPWTFTDATGNYNNASSTVHDHIDKADATIVVTGYTVTYNGAAHTATGTAKGVLGESLSGLDLTGTTHTNASDYPTDPWTFTDATGNYNNANSTVHDHIDKADATIAVTPYHVTYDANPHLATGAATGVGGVDLSAGLNLTGTTHMGAGDYPADAWTFTGGTNYNDANSTVHDIIDKAGATIHVNGYMGVYDGNAHGATGSATGVKGEDLSNLLNLGASFTNVPGGTANWTFAGDTNYKSANGMATITLSQADATIKVNAYTGVYDGNAHGATGSAVGVKGEDLSSLLNLGASFSNVPGGTANWAFAGDTNYKSANGTATITISKADAAISVTPYSVTYDANPHTATATATGVKGEVLSGLDLSGTTHTSAGTYTDTWTFTDLTGNYNNSNNTVSDVIKKAKATIVVTPYSVTYDGTSHTASGTATGVSGEALNGLDLSGTTHINAGTYNGDPWTFTDATGNYYNANATVNDSIAKGSAIINVTAYNTTYDGNAHTATGTAHGVEIPAPVDLTSLLHLSGTTHTSPGDYASDAWTFDGNNNYNSTSGSVHDAIGKADAVISVTAYNVTYDANPHTAAGTAIGVKGENLSGLDLSGTNHTNAGTYNDNWTFTDTTGNYNNASAQVGDVISKAPSVTTITPGSLTVTYDGLSHSVSGMVTGAGGLSQSVAVSYAPGGSTAPVNAGTYTANATYAGDANHFGSSASPVTITIGKAPLTITADNKTKLLNAPNPALTFSYSGFVNGENQSVLSGTTTCSTTAVTTSPVGSYPITCSGQTSTNYSITYVQGTLKITYVAGGICAGDVGHQIRQPINVDGTSVWKQGSTVPAKFAACDANGVSIGTAGVVTNFFVYKTVAGTVANVDETNITSTNSLNWNFDPTAQQWIFNIGTKTGAVSSPSTTYYFEIDLNDGSKILFQFGLK